MKIVIIFNKKKKKLFEKNLDMTNKFLDFLIKVASLIPTLYELLKKIAH